jgi:hypothetical protein
LYFQWLTIINIIQYVGPLSLQLHEEANDLDVSEQPAFYVNEQFF